ncbi:hypothetical protein AAHK20_01510 [Trinickia sp. YCB016]
MNDNDLLHVHDGIRYEVLRQRHVERAAECLCARFSASGPLASALGLSASELRPVVEPVCEQAARDELSLVALSGSDGEVLGCLVMLDYAVSVLADDADADAPSLPQAAPLFAFLDQLRALAPDLNHAMAGQIAHWAMAAVSREGRGICTAMLGLAQTRARERGFRSIVAECTAAGSQRVAAEKFKHVVRAELRYADFAYGGEYPFQRIREPSSCLLTFGAL